MTDATGIARAGSSPLYEEYWSQGYALVRAQFSSAEVEEIQQECRRLFGLFDEEKDRHNLRVQFRKHQSGGTVLDRIDPFRDLSPTLGRVANDPRILKPVGDVLYEPGLLFKDKMILKGPGTHGYGVHQDYTNWQEIPAPANVLLSVLLAVDDATASNGGLEFFPGLHFAHHRAPEKPSNIFDPKAGLVPDETLAGCSPFAPELQAGDLVLFHSLTPHQSGINRSASTRCAIYFSYVAASYGDLYATYYRNFFSYLREDRASEGAALHFR